MSIAIGHFAVGAGLTGGALLAARLKKKVRNNARIMFGGGLWAMIPDAGKLIPLLKILHDGWWADIFWFHRLVDTKIDPADSYWMSTAFIAFMLMMLIVFWVLDKKPH